MTELSAAQDGLALTVNGSLLAVGIRPQLGELEGALKSVALSDSPVIIRGQNDDRSYLLDRLHKLGRRSDLPVHQCRSPTEAEPLFASVMDNGDTEIEALGTWALHSVDAWPRDLQIQLNHILEALDLGRLHGRLRHEKIPRIVVLQESETDNSKLLPELSKRLSYFNLSTKACVPGEEKKK